MKKVKVLSTAFIGAMAALALASCGGNSKKNTITIYAPVGDSLKGFLENAIKVFNQDKENSKWKVEINTSFSGSYDTVKSSVINDLNVGNQPAIAYCYPDHVAQYLKTGKVINIQKYIDGENGYSKEEWADFVEAYMQEGTSFSVEGRYTVPMARSSEVMFYNKTVLEENGIAVPETWDELWTACEQLKTIYPNSVPLGYDSSANWIISHLEEQGAIDNTKYYTDGSKPGAEKVVFNNDVMANFLTDLRAKYKKGLFTTKDVSGTNSSNNFKTYTKDSNGNDKAFKGHFFSIGSTGGAKYQVPDTHDENGTKKPNFRAEITKNPHLTGTTLKCISQGPSLVLLDQGSEEKNLAVWKLVKCFLSKECQIEYSIGSGYMPIRKSVYEDQTFKDKLNNYDTDERRLINTCISMGNELTENLYTSDTFVGSDKARLELATIMINVMKGKDSANLVKDQLKKSEDNVKYFVNLGK